MTTSPAALIRDAARLRTTDCDLDDRAATYSRLAQVYAALGQHDAARKHSQQAEAAWRAFADEQAEVVRLLDAALS